MFYLIHDETGTTIETQSATDALAVLPFLTDEKGRELAVTLRNQVHHVNSPALYWSAVSTDEDGGDSIIYLKRSAA